jgi:hypothetical protein
MPRHLRWLPLYACLLPALAGCAIASSSGAPTPPCAAQTAAATATPTPSLGTRTEGPLVITTDRTVYAPADVVLVSITNRVRASAGAAVYLGLTPPPGCPGAWAERLQGSVWQEVRVCFPRGGGELNPGNGEITVQPGATYATGVAPRNNPSDHEERVPFPTGVYRIAVHYYLVASPVATIRYGVGGGFIAYSQPFRVCTCGVCT